ncbi:MAG: hypothetical protein SCARUB_04904 [Candidatus Scalindua rubra]|uniref:Uncharacterized protein n=1 Tax=Candidatus Scalindua rubra TaxID=1872076 RepID=A0A1E3X2W9_9BACT|nr:MAG: hypothetical protein SCARUB_04904 [Candidatus Scalindua rubra]
MRNHILKSVVFVLVGLCFYSCEEEEISDLPEETYLVKYKAHAVGDSLILTYSDEDEQNISERLYANPSNHPIISWETEFETTGNRELRIVGHTLGQGINTEINLYIFDSSYGGNAVVWENASADENECFDVFGAYYQCSLIASWYHQD